MPCWSVFGDGLKRMFGESRQKRKSSNSVAPIWRDNVQVVGRAAWGRSCGSAKLLAGTLRCLRLCWRLPWNWSPVEQLGRCPKPHQRRCLWTPQGGISPLTPFARLSWLLFHASSACLALLVFLLHVFPCGGKHQLHAIELIHLTRAGVKVHRADIRLRILLP